MDRIARNATTVVCPVIDVIDEDTLEVHFDKKSVQVGGFDWGLQVKKKQMKKPTKTGSALCVGCSCAALFVFFLTFLGLN